jgi:hypothetical protein
MQLKRNHADASSALIALAGRLHRLTIEGYLYSSDIRVGFATI